MEDLARKQVAETAAAIRRAAAAAFGAAAAPLPPGRIKFAFLLSLGEQQVQLQVPGGGGGEAGGGPAPAVLAHVAAYYTWRLYKIRSTLAALGVAPPPSQHRPPAPPGVGDGSRQRLSVEDRLALLGETPLATTSRSSASAAARGVEGLSVAVGAATGGSAAAAAAAVGISAVDKSRLLEALHGNFVKAQVGAV